MSEPAATHRVPQPEPLPQPGDRPPPPLAGGRLRLYRIADALGVWNLRTKILVWWNAGHAFDTRFFDPFEGPRVAWDMTPKLASDGRDHIEIESRELPWWLSPKLTSLRGYDPEYCFRSLYYSAKAWRIDILDGGSGIAFFGTPGDRGQMVFDIYFRRGISPSLTSSQGMRFNERKRSMKVVTPEAIRDLYSDALSQEWREYQPQAQTTADSQPECRCS